MICFRFDQRAWVQDQWEYLMSHWSVRGQDWVRHAPADWQSYGRPRRIETAAELPDDRPLVVFASEHGRYIQGEVPLLEYRHLGDPIYFFGGDNLNLNDEEDLGGRIPDHLVYVETHTQHEMYSFMAAAIVLYDRWSKAIGDTV